MAKYTPEHSLALDKLIAALERQRPSARKPLRTIKRALELNVPAFRRRTR